MVALFGRHGQDVPNGVAARYAELSIGGRVSYAVTPHVKLVAESGYMEKRPDGSATQRLAKLTFAPTWSTGPGFWTGPNCACTSPQPTGTTRPTPPRAPLG